MLNLNGFFCRCLLTPPRIWTARIVASLPIRDSTNYGYRKVVYRIQNLSEQQIRRKVAECAAPWRLLLLLLDELLGENPFGDEK